MINDAATKMGSLMNSLKTGYEAVGTIAKNNKDKFKNPDGSENYSPEQLQKVVSELQTQKTAASAPTEPAAAPAADAAPAAAANKPAEAAKPAIPELTKEKTARLAELTTDLESLSDPAKSAEIIQKHISELPKKDDGSPDMSPDGIQKLTAKLTTEKAAIQYEKETGKAPDIEDNQTKEERTKNLAETMVALLGDIKELLKSSGIIDFFKDPFGSLSGDKKDKQKINYPEVAIFADMFGGVKRSEIAREPYNEANGLVLKMKAGTPITAPAEGVATYDEQTHTMNIALNSGQKIAMTPVEKDENFGKGVEPGKPFSVTKETVLGKLMGTQGQEARLNFKESDKDGKSVDPSKRFPMTNEVEGTTAPQITEFRGMFQGGSVDTAFDAKNADAGMTIKMKPGEQIIAPGQGTGRINADDTMTIELKSGQILKLSGITPADGLKKGVDFAVNPNSLLGKATGETINFKETDVYGKTVDTTSRFPLPQAAPAAAAPEKQAAKKPAKKTAKKVVKKQKNGRRT